MPKGHVIELGSPRSPVAERWEAGSDFDFSEETGSATLPWQSRPVTLGLRARCHPGRLRMGSATAWLASAVDAVVLLSGRRGLHATQRPGGGLPLGADRWRRPAGRTSAGDVVFVSAMFGAQPSVRVEGSGAIIEDHSHDLLAPPAIASTADYVIVSLRKTLPLPDGGAAWSPQGHDLPPERTMTDAHASGALERMSAMALKRMYLDGEPVGQGSLPRCVDPRRTAHGRRQDLRY